MKKSRKLAWCVLGVVLVAAIGFFAWLSSLYTPWERDSVVFSSGGGDFIIQGSSRRQKFSWLPGADSESRFPGPEAADR